MKLDIDTNEKQTLIMGIDSLIASAKRQQNTSKQPQIVEVWRTTEATYQHLRNKLNEAK